MTTFQYEDSLRELPLPDIESTFDQLLKSLEPLYYADGYYKHPLDKEHLNELSDNLQAFVDSSAASKLQKKLGQLEKAEECYLDNLNLDIHNHSSFLDTSDDVLPRNPFLVLADDAIPNINQTDRAAVLVISALKFISALQQNILAPDLVGSSEEPLSMHPYLNLFGTTRYPAFKEDKNLSAQLTDSIGYNSDTDDVCCQANSWSEDTTSSGRSQISSRDVTTERSVDDTEQTLVSETTDCRDLRRHINTPVSNSSSLCNTDLNASKYGITCKKYTDSKHILIICKGHYYKFDVFDNSYRLLYDCNELSKLFEYIIQDLAKVDTFKNSTAIGSLTSHSYKSWKYARGHLKHRCPNELKLIDSALFVLVLDDTANIKVNSTKDSEKLIKINSEITKNLYYGTSLIDEKGHQVGSCTSRWYDKLQLIVSKDSRAAVIWDSFTCDGSVVLRFVSDIYTESVLRLAKEANGGDPSFSLWPQILELPKKKGYSIDDTQCFNPRSIIEKIEWDFDIILNTQIHLSETKLADLISRYDIEFESVFFGDRFAQRLGVRADSMVQIALQVAHYALYGKTVYGFEPVSTRNYKNSRSSFINLQNKNVLELCQVFISDLLNEQEKLEKFIQVCKEHTENVKRAKTGKDFERHFVALKYLYDNRKEFEVEFSENENNDAKSVFESPLVSPSFSPELLVANCGNAATLTFGITPTVPHGFGIGYVIKEDQCHLTVTSQFRQGRRLLFMMNWVLLELRNACKQKIIAGTCLDGTKKIPTLANLKESSKPINYVPQNRFSSNIAINSGYGLFDFQAHTDSRSISVLNSRNNSQISLKTSDFMIQNLSNQFNDSVTTHSFTPTEQEKKNTGHQISQIHPAVDSESDDDSLM